MASRGPQRNLILTGSYDALVDGQFEVGTLRRLFPISTAMASRRLECPAQTKTIVLFAKRGRTRGRPDQTSRPTSGVRGIDDEARC